MSKIKKLENKNKILSNENNIIEDKNNQRIFSESNLDKPTTDNIIIKKESIDLINQNVEQTEIGSPTSEVKVEENNIINNNNKFDKSKRDNLSTISNVFAFNNNINEKIKKFCNVQIKRIYNIFILIFSLFLIIISSYDLFYLNRKNKKDYFIKKWYIILFEILLGFMRISFFFLNIFVIKEKRIKNIIILSLNSILIILYLLVIIIFIIRKYNLLERIINLNFCLFLFLSSLVSILYIKIEVKKKKNVMQNIEEIINFTEINQQGNQKKFEKGVFESFNNRGKNELVEESKDEHLERNDKE